jgi:NADPH:quinone reductase-like Zn-dependent oxidoreductase
VAGTFKADLLSRFVRQKFVRYVTTLDKEDLKLLGDFMQTGKVTPVIDRTYKLSENRGGDAVFRRRPPARESSSNCPLT